MDKRQWQSRNLIFNCEYFPENFGEKLKTFLVLVNGVPLTP